MEEHDEFRDHLATVDKKGKRIWIYPKKPKGRFYNWRGITSIFLFALLFANPFIKINGEPWLLFNVLESKFILFSIVFTPQDMHLFALAMVTLMLFIVLFTVVFGRLFCGWVCPQTIFMEHFFRRIEYFIEGDAGEQRRLNNSPWTLEKFLKKATKHTIFFAFGILIANTFLAYVIGADAVFEIINEPINQNLGGFIAMLVFSGLFYGTFAFLREQVCTTICPYGRMQSVLLVPETVVVHYDFVRGEPRGKVKKANPITQIQKAVNATSMLDNIVEEKPLKLIGDCIDCKACVHVCPTGIDIRNGTQLECVNCTACIDACDEIMDKVGRKRGLIRYDSYTGVKEGKRKIFTVRAIAYSAVLTILLILQAFLFGTRTEVETLIIKVPGQLFQEVEGNYRNLYNWEVINKTAQDIDHIEFRLKDMEGKIELVGAKDNIVSPKQGLVKGVMFIDLPQEKVTKTKTKLKVEIYSNGKLIDEYVTNFLGPIQ